MLSQVTDIVRAIKTALPKVKADGTVRAGKSGKAAMQLVRRNTPVFSSNWYLRLGFDRIVMDSLDEWANPDVERDRDRGARRREKRGQEAWWEPGELAPTRAPALDGAVGGDR